MTDRKRPKRKPQSRALAFLFFADIGFLLVSIKHEKFHILVKLLLGFQKAVSILIISCELNFSPVMQCISSFNKHSLLLTFNIYIYSRLRLNSITVFSSTSTRTHSGCVELPQRLQLEINCLNGKKTKIIKPVWIRKVYFSVEKFVVVVVVRYDLCSNVTFCLVWFVQKIQGRD